MNSSLVVLKFQTLACDLRSLLAVGLKRKILQDLQNGCPSYEDPVKRQEVYDRYKSYLSSVSNSVLLANLLLSKKFR